jgi:hypothetical protein
MKQYSINSYHQKTAVLFDKASIFQREAAQLFECDSDHVAAHHAYLALKFATLSLK